MSDTETTIAPGIYHDIAFPEYQSWPLMNASTLVHGLTSMEHLKLALEGGMNRDTPAMNFGRALHARLLEPDLFNKAYQVAEPCMAVLKSGARKGERCGYNGAVVGDEGWLCRTHSTNQPEPENVITRDESLRIDAIVSKVKRHPIIKLIRQHGGTETSVVWESLGVQCKARLDKWVPGGKCPPTIIDVKKVAAGRGSLLTFERTILDYHYHIKAAWYIDAIEQQAGVKPQFIWVVVEDSPPYSIGIYRCMPETYSAGRWEYLNLLMKYKRCVESGVWPGYSEDIDDINAPGWYLKRFDRTEMQD